jgi:NAD-dependent deacetylase
VHHPIEEYDLPSALSRAAELLRPAKRVTVLSGAGVSAESGVATFRGAGGLWEGHRVEDVATPHAFAHDPALVWRFYNLRRASMSSVRPNPGHLALVELEKRLGDGFTLVTQNIDGLHLTAGNRRVLEIHGRLSRVKCTECEYVEDRPGEALPELPRCPQCEALLRPDVVWFEEMLPPGVWREACLASRCDCFLVVGTSAVVYPAAGLIQMARSAGASVLEFNVERTEASHAADVSLYGPSGQTLPEVLRRL